MKKLKFSHFLMFFAIAILSVLFNNCQPQISFESDLLRSKNGTNVGNASNPTSQKLLYAVCGIITRCHNEVTLDQCEDGVASTRGFATALGLNSNFDLYSEIIQGELNGTLTGNSATTDSCYQQINTLTCADSKVVSAYDPQLQNPFSATPNLISDPACQKTYSPPKYEDEIIVDNPLAYWRLNETSGTIANDMMGVHNGTFTTGAGLLLGEPGTLVGSADTAVKFGAQGPGKIDFQLPTINSTAGTWVTVEFWMKWSGAQGNFMPFGFYNFGLWLNTNNNEFGFNTGNADRYGIMGPAVAAMANQWVHVVAVMYNMGSNNDISQQKLYINGQLQNLTQTAGTPRIITATNSFRISSWAQDEGFLFDGSLDEFAVYNYALSPTQISRHYMAGQGVFEK